MMMLLRLLSSLKLTLLGMVMLGLGAVLSYGNPMTVSIWVLVVPMSILAINLIATIVTNRLINGQPGLLLFHICLLTIVILAGVGRLIHLDAHVELAQGQVFTPDLMMEVRSGPMHMGGIDQVAFIQGHYTVDYLPRLRRRDTHSEVLLPGPDGRAIPQDVGDDRPLILQYYRFYTTFNKGFSPILMWIPVQGEPITGRINMPAYPLFEYKQDNQWTPPGTNEVIKFWLQVDAGLTEEKAWVLDGRNATGKLVVTVGEQRVELIKGEELQLAHGRLRYIDLSTWMGYRIFYDPTIHWMFWASFIGVLGLMQYFWTKMKRKSWLGSDENAALEGDSAVATDSEERA